MSDRVLLISWGQPVRGREEHSLEVFNDTVGLYGRMQQEGRIERFDVTLLEPNGGMNGYMQLHGSAAQLADVRADEEFRTMMINAALIVDDLTMLDGSTNEGVAREMAMYQEAISKVPQRT